MSLTPLDPLLTIDAVGAAAAQLAPWIVRTPVYDWHSDMLKGRIGNDTQVNLKLELFQNTNSFKPRGALNVMLHGDPAQLKNGVVAVSGGNHGIAVAYAAKVLGHHAKIVLPKTASPVRRAKCEYYGAEVVTADTFAHAFEIFEEIKTRENRLPVHPFEGPYTVQGTATLGLEWWQQAGHLDAVIIPIGGGGLLAGIGAVMKQLNPAIKIYGVEPIGAPTIYNSLQAGHPVKLDGTNTIADSLAVPAAQPYTFNILRQVMDDIVLLSDDEMRAGMDFLFHDMKLVAEPACAASAAALMGPLCERLRGARVGVIACGSNVDIAVFAKEIFRAELG